MWLANRIRDTWDEYAGKETRHARVRGRVRVSEASDCPIYQGMSEKLKAVQYRIRQNMQPAGGEEAHTRKKYNGNY